MNLKKMETIFDYDPSVKELVQLFSYNEKENTMCYGFSVLPELISRYDDIATEEEKLLDMAKLFELRGDVEKASTIWKKIPDIEQQYRLGFDYNIENI